MNVIVGDKKLKQNKKSRFNDNKKSKQKGVLSNMHHWVISALHLLRVNTEQIRLFVQWMISLGCSPVTRQDLEENCRSLHVSLCWGRASTGDTVLLPILISLAWISLLRSACCSHTWRYLVSLTAVHEFSWEDEKEEELREEEEEERKKN